MMLAIYLRSSETRTRPTPSGSQAKKTASKMDDSVYEFGDKPEVTEGDVPEEFGGGEVGFEREEEEEERQKGATSSSLGVASFSTLSVRPSPLPSAITSPRPFICP